MGYFIIFIGTIVATVVFLGSTFYDFIFYPDSIILALLSWILFNQLIYLLGKEGIADKKGDSKIKKKGWGRSYGY